MGTKPTDLSPEAAQTLEAILMHRTRKGAAKALGITYGALAARLRENPAIFDAMRENYRDNLRALQGRIQAAAMKAAKFIEDALDDVDAPFPSRLAAAFKLLEMTVELNKTNDLSVRFERLETAAKEKGILG